MKIFDFFHFKVLAGKPQRVRKNTALSLLAVACMFLWHSNFLCHFLHMHFFWTVLLFWTVLYIQHSFLGTCILEWNVLICCLKITRQQICVKYVLEYGNKKISQWQRGPCTSLHLPPPLPRKVLSIFFALPSMNGPLPAELKFRENRETMSNYFGITHTALLYFPTSAEIRTIVSQSDLRIFL